MHNLVTKFMKISQHYFMLSQLEQHQQLYPLWINLLFVYFQNFFHSENSEKYQAGSQNSGNVKCLVLSDKQYKGFSVYYHRRLRGTGNIHVWFFCLKMLSQCTCTINNQNFCTFIFCQSLNQLIISLPPTLGRHRRNVF